MSDVKQANSPTDEALQSLLVVRDRLQSVAKRLGTRLEPVMRPTTSAVDVKAEAPEDKPSSPLVFCLRARAQDFNEVTDALCAFADRLDL